MRTSFWFVPAVMTAVAAALSWLSIGIRTGVRLHAEPTVLAALAGAIMTLTGVVFSLTIITMHLASAQFGPRLMRAFMRDRSNQVALGTFLAAFTYLLVALALGPSAGSLGTMGAYLVTVGSVGMLIFFIHHVATQVQAHAVVAKVRRQLRDAIDDAYPARVEPPPALPRKLQPVRAPRPGYFGAVGEAMAEVGPAHVIARAGDFVLEGEVLARAEDPEAVAAALTVHGRRTEAQDVRFSIEQLTQMAVRSLSPGINDPYTAVACIHRLTEAYVVLAERPTGPIGVGAARVERPTREELIEVGLAEIRPYARTRLVQAALLQGLARIEAAGWSVEGERRALSQHVKDSDLVPEDRRRLESV